MHRGAWFAATDRSYRRSHVSVGAVIGRERSSAYCLMHRGAWFAATDRSYRDCAGAVIAAAGKDAKGIATQRFAVNVRAVRGACH